MNKKLFILLLVFLFFKQLIWVSLVPLWHFPDEQAHFAQVAYLGEMGTQPGKTPFDLTEEIRISENLLGTERDNSGNNRFTFHPEYKIEYAPVLYGIYEEKINKLAKDPILRQMKKNEASHYPPIYYFVISLVYRVFYYKDLIIRVFLSRIIQLIFYLGTVFLTYKIGKMIFKSSLETLTLIILVAFHPMFSFVGSGVNSDNIGNFSFSLFIYFSLVLLKDSINVKNTLGLLLITLLAIFIKPQNYISVPVTLMLIIYKLFESKIAFNIKTKILSVFTVLFVIFLIFLSKTNNAIFILLTKFFDEFSFTQFYRQFVHFALPQFYREALPWYWGIFDWLGVTYPRIVHRIINWSILASTAGFLIYMVKNFKKINRWPINGVIFLLLLNLLFFIGVYQFDYVQYVASGYNFHLGVQGRYFFPLIISHMLFIVIGIKELFRFFPKLVGYSIKILASLMILLHWYAIYTIVKTYYDYSSLYSFIIQASQYKPWFFKGIYLVILIIAALTANLIFLIKYLKYKNVYDKSNTKQSFAH